MRTRLTLLPVVLMVAVGALAMGGGQPNEPQYTSDFGLKSCKLVPRAHNPYFSLKPGAIFHFEGEENGGFAELQIKVLNQTKTITFVVDGKTKAAKTRVIEERHQLDGELVEISRNYFAGCEDTGNVYYCGEDTDIYEDGEIVSHEGSWRAGVNGALPGLVMPSVFLLGARYFQEVASPVALDRAEHVEMGLTVETPAGVFKNCVKVLETSELDPGAEEFKIYAPGVGLIVDDTLELVSFHQ